MRTSPVPPNQNGGQSYDKLLRSISFLQNEKSMMLQEIQSLKSRLAAQSRSNEASPSMGSLGGGGHSNSVDGSTVTKLLEQSLRSGTLTCLLAMKNQLKKALAVAFFRWRGKSDLAGQKEEYEKQIDRLKAELMNKPDEGDNPWKNTAMTLLARQKKDEERGYSRSPTRGRSKDRAGYGLSGQELHAHRKPWGSREGERHRTGISGTSAHAWKRDPTSPRSREHYSNYRRASAGSPNSLRSGGSSTTSFQYNHNSSFPEASAMHHVLHGSDDPIMPSGEEKEQHPSSHGLTIDVAAHGGSVHEREEHDLSALHKHIRRHDTHHETHAHGHDGSSHSMDTRSRTTNSRSQSSPPSPRYLNHTANFKNSTYRFYNHNSASIPDFFLHQPSSPSEMQEYVAEVGAHRLQMNRRSRSPAGSPKRLNDDSSNFSFSSSFTERHHFASSKSSGHRDTYRRNQTASFNDYGKPKFVSPTRRSRSADSARRVVSGAARNMTSPMLHPHSISMGRSQSIKNKSKQLYKPRSTESDFGGMPSYMTPTFSSKHMSVGASETSRAHEQHQHEVVQKRVQSRKMAALSKKHTANSRVHYGYDLSKYDEPPRQRTSISTSTSTSTSSGSRHAPRFMQATLSAKGTHKVTVDDELRARVRAQHDLEHSKFHSATYSREHISGGNFVHANSEHLPLLSHKEGHAPPDKHGSGRGGAGAEASERDVPAKGSQGPTSSADEEDPSGLAGKHARNENEPHASAPVPIVAPAPSAQDKVAARMARLKERSTEDAGPNGTDGTNGTNGTNGSTTDALLDELTREAAAAMEEIDSHAA